MSWKLFKKTVAAAGTPERLSAVSLPALEVFIQPVSTNTGAVFLGDSSVSATKGIHFVAPQANTQIPTLALSSILLRQPVDLHDIWIDAAVNSEGVNVFYLPAP